MTCLRQLEPALRSRAIFAFLQRAGVAEPESKHICSIEKLVFSDKPSARVFFKNDIVISRNYDRLEYGKESVILETMDILISENGYTTTVRSIDVFNELLNRFTMNENQPYMYRGDIPQTKTLMTNG